MRESHMTVSKSSSPDRKRPRADARPKAEATADWNVVVSTCGENYRSARATLREFGRVWRTEYYNVLVMRVRDIRSFLEDLRSFATINPNLLKSIGRIAPAAVVFDFATGEEFERSLRDFALHQLPALTRKSFHCRIHGRGLRSIISSRTAEQNLNRALLVALAVGGTPGSLDFTDPDAVLAVETVGHRAGASLWMRDDLNRYPFLRAD
jgi:tRNA(Ser,Leu) C12 N-acetylase TAN1